MKKSLFNWAWAQIFLENYKGYQEITLFDEAETAAYQVKQKWKK